MGTKEIDSGRCTGDPVEVGSRDVVGTGDANRLWFGSCERVGIIVGVLDDMGRTMGDALC